MKLCVVGLGYIGLPTACLFAKANLDVTGVDLDKQKVEKVSKGVCPFSETGLPELLKQVVESKRFTATTDVSICKNADVIIVAVPTPLKDKRMDGTALKNAVNSIAPHLKKGALIVIESTISPNTTSIMVKKLLEKVSKLKATTDFYLAHCPERAFPGKTLHEIVNNDRVIGGIDEKSTEKAVEVYSKIVKGTIYPTNSTVAEIAKLSENTYRDVNIAFANDLAMLCEKFGVNVFKVIELANKHPRVNIHLPGPGVGGHCIPLDPWFLTEEFESKIIPLSRNLNDSMPHHVVELLEKSLKGEKGKIALLGLAYKPDVDDMRESPAFEVAHLLTQKGFLITAFDPHIESASNITLARSAVDASKDALAIVIVTKHSKFKDMNWGEVKKVIKNPLIIDCVNLLEKPPAGFRMLGIGRGDLK